MTQYKFPWAAATDDNDDYGYLGKSDAQVISRLFLRSFSEIVMAGRIQACRCHEDFRDSSLLQIVVIWL